MDTDFTLPPRLDTANAPALAKRLSALRGSPVRIDASEVTFAGALGLQVLVSARRSWEADNHSLEVLSPSGALIAAMGTLGIDHTAIGLTENQEL